jgi:hypothetical protein
MRGNPNTRETHECEMVNGQGMRVLANPIPADAVHRFTSYLNLISRNPARRIRSTGGRGDRAVSRDGE